jgi:serine/threonine protein phosphatase PrpC
VNEDSLLARSDSGLWAVADGMGGHVAGDVASQKVCEALRRLPVTDGLDRLVDDAVAALRHANRELVDLAATRESNTSIGSTVVGLAISDGQFRCFWAGDSRAYRLRDGEIEQLTRDHSLVQDLLDAGMLSADEAVDHPNSNIITRAVGVAEELNVETMGGEVRPGDQYLLATDGLTRMVADDELATALSTWQPDEAAGRLIDVVLSRGAPDNVTMVVVRVPG